MRQRAQFLDLTVPVTDLKTGLPLAGRSLTLAGVKRDSLQRLYRNGLRVAPWAGAAHGVLQAVNTYEHHEGSIRGCGRTERNMLKTVTGDFATLDRKAWGTLSSVLALN
jgi:hypothetical protein